MRARLAIIALVLTGCAASRPADLTTRLWSCAIDADCVDGYTCADRSVLGDDFCAPACTYGVADSCDGLCTGHDECLETCTVLADGTSTCLPGRACIRLDFFSDDGLCYPTQGCSVSADCPEGTACFNDAFRIPASLSAPGVLDQPFQSDQLYCVAVPDGMRCPVGYIYIAGAEDAGRALCLPTCDAPARCPPLMACIPDIGSLVGSPGRDLCFPGFWGLPCEDDSQCALGECLDVGGGRRACTETCGNASSLSNLLGCDLLEIASAIGVANFDFACDTAADVCVPRVVPGGLCNDAAECLAGACVDTGSDFRICAVPCTTDTQCGLPELTPARRGDFYCAIAGGATSGVCVQRLPVGSACSLDLQCLSGACRGFGMMRRCAER